MPTTNVATILAETARRVPDKTAVVLGDLRIPYGVLWQQALRYAAALREQGVQPGDRVAILIPNTPHFPMAYYGALAAGASVVPVHALLVADEIAYVLQDSGAKALVVAAPLLGEGAKAAEIANVRLLVVMDPGEASDVIRLDALAAATQPLPAMVQRDPADEAVVLYTSGTTGVPKGAVLSHDNILWNATLTAFDTVRLQADDVFLGVLPLFHSFGQVVVMNGGFRVGATIVLLPRFDGPTALGLIAKEQVTVFAGVPTMYVGLLEAAASSDLRPQLRLAVSGGAALPVAVIDRFKDTFGADIYEGYGLSETSPVATFNQERYGRKPGTVGCPIWGVEVEIAKSDVEGRIELVPAGEIGEIVIRGHNVFTGYLNRPEATAAVMVDGWFRSGDLGTKDADGFVTIVDRKKEMIIRGGFNVYPREVEEVLSRFPGVSQVAVVGVPDDTYGEEIVALITPQAGATVDGEELKAWSKQHLAAHKYPRVVDVVPALPTGPTGKILKREITERLRAGEPIG
jgi:long-chain acyl-CoA synthetase